MKPEPDDSSEIEPPMTRAMFATELDAEAGGGPVPATPTLEGETRHGPSPTAATRFESIGAGPGGGSQTSWMPGSQLAPAAASASGGPNRRGVVGKIEPGQLLYQKYLVLHKLGGGAMGDVWLVRHATLKSQHALKLIVPNFATNAVALMRFQREFEVMATLRHEHAVTIYDAIIDDEGGYIDMEYLEGHTIHEVLATERGRRGDPSDPLMPLGWIVRVVDQLCEVLQVAHHKGIVHRDLKPSNLMLLANRPPGREYLKVLDFGIAKIRDDPEGVAGRDLETTEQKTQGYVGTPSYGSPEQAMGSADLDGRADLYTVGIMLYEFVTGRVPFRGNHWQVMSQHASATPPPFAEVNPDLRPMPELERAILRVLAKSPDDRPQTARALAEEIRRAVQAVLPAGSPSLGPSTWDAFPAHDPSPTPGPLPSDRLDEFDHEPPATQADTLVAHAARSWKDNHAAERPSDLGPSPAVYAFAVKPARWRFSAVFRSRKWMLSITMTACSALLLVMVSIPVAKRVMNSAAGSIGETADSPEPPRTVDREVEPPSRSVILKEAVNKPPDFESIWPANYRPVEGYTGGMPWPERVRRSLDQAVFVKFADGVYLPDTFEPEDRADLLDGWPRAIVKNGIRFLRMPAGTWNMGAWWDDPDAVDRPDLPVHPVRLTGFYLQEFEVTHGQFEDYLRRVDDAAPGDWAEVFNLLKKKVGPDLARRYPASNLARKRAEGFARELGAQLPTEAQWEYAARSLGRSRIYVWGDGPPPGPDLARVDASDGAPAPVGTYAKPGAGPGRDRTEQGAGDMAGNVREMCRDAWVSSYKKGEAAVVDPCAPPGDKDTAEYSVRGGSYASIGKECATTHRGKMAAADLAEDVGFRLVVECPEPRKPR